MSIIIFVIWMIYICKKYSFLTKKIHERNLIPLPNFEYKTLILIRDPKHNCINVYTLCKSLSSFKLHEISINMCSLYIAA